MPTSSPSSSHAPAGVAAAATSTRTARGGCISAPTASTSCRAGPPIAVRTPAPGGRRKEITTPPSTAAPLASPSSTRSALAGTTPTAATVTPMEGPSRLARRTGRSGAICSPAAPTSSALTRLRSGTTSQATPSGPRPSDTALTLMSALASAGTTTVPPRRPRTKSPSFRVPSTTMSTEFRPLLLEPPR